MHWINRCVSIRIIRWMLLINNRWCSRLHGLHVFLILPVTSLFRPIWPWHNYGLPYVNEATHTLHSEGLQTYCYGPLNRVSVIRYTFGELFSIRNQTTYSVRSQQLNEVKRAGLLHYRGRRAGHKVQRDIMIVHVNIHSLTDRTPTHRSIPQCVTGRVTTRHVAWRRATVVETVDETTAVVE